MRLLLRRSRYLAAFLSLALSPSLFAQIGGSPQIESEQRFPLSTEGRFIVDAQGERFKLKSANWYGANLEGHAAWGLDQQPIEHIVDLILDWGFNSVRLTFSNEMLHDREPIAEAEVQANPQLFGLRPLKVFDATIDALTQAGVAVILNNHTTTSEWCCNFDRNGLWYQWGSLTGMNYSSQQWHNDWLMLVQRYRDNPLVVGADLRNEVRTARFGASWIPESPNWGWGNRNDWHQAAEDLGRMINLKNPDILVIVEGINWWGTIPILGSGERPHLKPVQDLPIRLKLPNKLVYAAHNYAFTGPRHTGEDSSSGGQPKYSDLDHETFLQTIHDEWGFVLEDGQHFTAPVWMNEFGVSRDAADEKAKRWFAWLVDYLIEHDVDFAYWPLNHEGFGLVSSDWSYNLKDDWRYEHLSRLLSAPSREAASKTARYTKIIPSRGDDNQSLDDHDWLVGAHKGRCPDDFRLIGMSRDHKGLCTDANITTPNGKSLHVEAVRETSTQHRTKQDWAVGLTKYECQEGFQVIGIAKHYWGSSGILCAENPQAQSNKCHTIRFDQGDQRRSIKGGNWAIDAYKGQCGDDEFVAGFAQRHGTPRALLCCELSKP